MGVNIKSSLILALACYGTGPADLTGSGIDNTGPSAVYAMAGGSQGAIVGDSLLINDHCNWAQEKRCLLFAAADEEGHGSTPEPEIKKELLYRPVTVGVELGTTGPGATVNWRFLGHLGLRVGFQYFSYSADDIDIEDINYSADLRLMSGPVALDFYPSKYSTFRITLGVLLNQNKLEGTATAIDPSETIKIGKNAYNLTDIGGLNLEAKQQVFSPYASIGGNVYLGKAKRWSLMGELGVAYTGSPDISLNPGKPGTVYQDDLDAETGEIEDAVKNFKFWPILKFGICFSF